MKPCCEDPKNRSEPEWDHSNGSEKSDIKITRCLVCGCRHFEVEVDPVQIGVEVI